MNSMYDYAVIGAGYTGLQIALQLKEQGANIIILDKQDFMGGSHRATPGPLAGFDRGLHFFPGTPISEEVLKELETTMGYSQIYEVTDNAPITFSSSEFKEFVGFGEDTPYGYDLMRAFLYEKRCEFTKPFNEIIFDYQNKLQGDFHGRSTVTKILFNEDHVGLMINGNKTLKAKQIVYCGHIKELLPLLPLEFFPNRVRLKLAKLQVVTAICLDLLHDSIVSDRHNLHVLQGSQKEELVPCFGLFHKPFHHNGKEQQVSQWMIFIPNDHSEEPEETVTFLKHLKRQIKRAYPTALDNVVAERIFVPDCMGLNEAYKTTNELVKGSDERLWVACPELNPFPHLLGSALQARWILSNMGFSSAMNHTEQVDSLDSGTIQGSP